MRNDPSAPRAAHLSIQMGNGGVIQGRSSFIIPLTIGASRRTTYLGRYKRLMPMAAARHGLGQKEARLVGGLRRGIAVLVRGKREKMRTALPMKKRLLPTRVPLTNSTPIRISTASIPPAFDTAGEGVISGVSPRVPCSSISG